MLLIVLIGEEHNNNKLNENNGLEHGLTLVGCTPWTNSLEVSHRIKRRGDWSRDFFGTRELLKSSHMELVWDVCLTKPFLLPKHWLIPNGIEIVGDAGDYHRSKERVVNQQRLTTRGRIRWVWIPDPWMWERLQYSNRSTSCPISLFLHQRYSRKAQNFQDGVCSILWLNFVQCQLYC